VLWGQSLLALRRFGWRAVNKIIAFVAHVVPEDKTKKIDTSGLLRGRNSQKSPSSHVISQFVDSIVAFVAHAVPKDNTLTPLDFSVVKYLKSLIRFV